MTTEAKSYFAMERGLNTEAPLLGFPDGYTSAEQNYELTIRGERRRRLGLALEAGGTALDLPTFEAGQVIKSHDWENASGLPNHNFVVVQVGHRLYIFDDANPISTTLNNTVLDFSAYGAPEATADQMAVWPLDSAFGRGHIFFFGKYTNPFYVEFDPTALTFQINQIDLEERNFVGVDDGYSNTAQPIAATATHTYNLKNRGWTDAFLASFQADQGLQPSKNMIPWLGLKRALTGSDFYDLDGIRDFSSDKLVSELFQDASAPQGHYVISPFNTTTTPEADSALAIANWTISSTSGGPRTLTFQTSGLHGLLVGAPISIVNLRGQYFGPSFDPVIGTFLVQGAYTVTAVPDTTHLSITVDFPFSPEFHGWQNQFVSLGTVYGAADPNPTGSVIDFRPKAGTFFAGRSWFAGIDTARLGGRIYFSQVIENDTQYGKCYQVADPTDERISDLVPSDGGVIVIPEAANILKLVPYNSAVLVFASNGVWEIGPGDLGYFAATSYSVRKVTDSGAVSPSSVVLADNLPVYWGVTDIYGIAPNPQTGYLEVTNISQQVINTFYNAIPLSRRHDCIGVYDDLSKRVIWAYSSSNASTDFSYDKGLVYDTRLRAFIPFSFSYSDANYLANIMLLKEAGDVSKVKYLGYINGQLVFGEANNFTDYKDFDIDEQPAYMVSGYDSFRQPSDFKSAPCVWVFSRKTEEGYDDSFEAIRPSSTLMQSRWEWADNASAGRWGRQQEIYRHQRTYVPTSTTDTYDDGIPVVVTKNKLRGKGRVLQLRFDAGQGKDSYIMGWRTNIARKVK